MCRASTVVASWSPTQEMPGSNSFYCPPTKLGEGNVFTGVYHYVQLGGGPHMTITHDALDLTPQTPPPRPNPAPPDLGTFHPWSWHPL